MNKMVNAVSMINVVSGINGVNEVTAANVTEKALKHELFETRTAIEDALIKLEKADTLLSYWTQEYGFADKPDPRAAIRWGSQVPSQNQDDEKEKEHGKQSYKWFYEYDMIFNFVDMAFDYIIATQEILKRAIETGEKRNEETDKATSH